MRETEVHRDGRHRRAGSAIQRSIDDSTLPADIDVDEMAAFFTTALIGVTASIRAEATPEQIHAACRVATSVLANRP